MDPKERAIFLETFESLRAETLLLIRHGEAGGFDTVWGPAAGLKMQSLYAEEARLTALIETWKSL